MNKTNTYYSILVCCTAMFILNGCDSGKVQKDIMPDSMIVKDGDIVLRKGTGLTSRAVTFADNGSCYSHCGIAINEKGRVMVIHAVPGEPDFEGDKDRVKLEPITQFYSSVRASKGCVLRFSDSNIAKKSARTAMEVYKRGTLFDHSYDDTDTTMMYCCELIEFSYHKNGINLIQTIRHDIDLPGLKLRHVIFPSDFTKSKSLKKIYTF